MNKSIYTVEKLNDATFRIDECGRDNCYLLIGGNQALLIDCSIGTGNLALLVKTLTNLPLTVAATHAHGDHVGAGYQFDSIYVPKAECTFNFRAQNLRYYRRQLLSNTMQRNGITKKNITGRNFQANWIPMEDGAVFDLGGRVIRTVVTPGHTIGSTIFLDATYKLMFTGDNACPVLPLHTYRALPLSRWLPGAQTMLSIAEQGYAMFCGHGDGRLTAEQLRAQIGWVHDILKQYPQGQRKHTRIFYPAFSKDGCVCFDPANL